ncbi:proteasome subunit alpha [Kribbella shirazensis]|uniref:Proteasome subunit alpha n=1 Tax=Kribbella shirazensis TaxID=1105143 RepID=A0A7X5VEK8_9ACTN|nr:proteasome subunit alpha [Kribbella shirazensis]NIK59371.1 proteasome alpha subunit [Kribbella shirazensis]
MSVPFYVSPEQLMRDRADFARKGIAKGRSAIALQYADGILFVAENRSPALHKVAEIYDRMAFAAVGRYNEFENLRIAGVRLADMRGYSYDRRDVTGRALANAYAQTLGAIFSSGGEKPLEVEILVAEVGTSAADDQIYRLTYDGSIADVRGYAVMGGPAEQVADYVGEHYSDGISLAGALRLAVDALGHDGTEVRQLTPDQLEVAVLDRTRTQVRKFKRISEETLERILSESSPADDGSGPADSGAGDSTDSGASGNGASGNGTSAQSGDGPTGSADDAPIAPPQDDAPVAPPEDPDDRPL